MISALGYLALSGRIVGLGLERPWVKALGQGRGNIAATTLSFGLAVLLILPLMVWQYFSGHADLSTWPSWIGYCVASGVLYAVGFHSYVYGMSRGEVSYLTPLYATAFIWLYLLDVTLGDAVFGLRAALGILAVTVGIVFLNMEPGASGWLALHPMTMLRRPGAIGMLTYAFCLATGRIIDARAADIAPPVFYAFIGNLPAVLFGLGWLLIYRRLGELPALLRERPVPAWGSAFVGIGAYILLLVAMGQGVNPSVAEPVSQLSVFISIWLGWLWFGENIRARWVPAALVVLGAALLVI
jgi:drug/metabolite transporter (DMT)-like permease